MSLGSDEMLASERFIFVLLRRDRKVSKSLTTFVTVVQTTSASKGPENAMVTSFPSPPNDTALR
jgi:hypothetical protein